MGTEEAGQHTELGRPASPTSQESGPLHRSPTLLPWVGWETHGGPLCHSVGAGATPANPRIIWCHIIEQFPLDSRGHPLPRPQPPDTGSSCKLCHNSSHWLNLRQTLQADAVLGLM